MEGARSTLLANLFDKKTIEILKKLLLKKDVFYLRDLSRETSVSLATTFRIVQKLLGLGLVSKEQQDNKFTWYKLQRDTDTFKEIYSLVMGATPDPLDMFKQQLKDKFPAGFQAYITRDKDKKVFVVSEIVKQTDVDEIAVKVQEAAGSKPNYMVVTPAFFEQMQTIGLLAKDKLSTL